jgi:cytochrome c biogenesis protein CcmG/thiol:disulfide interchange protein DsbE
MMVPSDEIEEYPRPRFSRFFLLPVAILVAGIALFAALRPAPDRDPDQTRQAPEFELPLLGGGTLTSAELKGDPVILNVWASWCGPCREEAPVFERIWRRHKGHGLRVIGVNTQDTDEAASDFVKDYGITYPIVRDAEQSLVEDLGLVGLPQTFFIDPEWQFLDSASGQRVASRGDTVVLGAISEEDLEARVAELLGSSAGPRP